MCWPRLWVAATMSCWVRLAAHSLMHAHGVVPKAQRAVVMQQGSDAVHIRDDSGDVGSGREGTYFKGAVGVSTQFVSQLLLIKVTIGILVDRDDICD